MFIVPGIVLFGACLLVGLLFGGLFLVSDDCFLGGGLCLLMLMKMSS